MNSKPHNLPLGGRTGPERLGGDAASGEPKTLVGAPSAENQHSTLDEARAQIARFEDMGAVEQMREAPDYWVGLVERLIEQLDLARSMLREKGVDPADLVHELEKVLGV